MRREILAMLLLMCNMLLCVHLVYAQKTESAVTNSSVESIIERVVGNSNREEESSEGYFYELTQYLFSIAHNGLLMNVKGAEELEWYGILTSFESASLKRYIKEHGEPLSFAELLLVQDLDRDKIKLLQPFLRFYNEYYQKEGPSKFYSTLLLRSSVIPERREGYNPISKEEYLKKPESRYLGNPFLLYGQFRIDAPKNISAIVTAKKDPGERGVDYISWSASIKNRGVLENFIIGSYNARKGQGLILWNGFSLSSSWDPASAIKRDYGLTSYTSAQEGRAFKGVAATISKGNFSLDLLTSFRNYDARVIQTGYTSILNTGLHNTPLTLQRRGSLHTNMAAISINYSNEIFNSGIIVSALCNSLPYAGRDSALIFMEQKMGRYRANAGINFRYFNNKTITSGELAFDMCGNIAAVTGVAVRLKSGNELSFTSKYYNSFFVSPLSYLTKIPGGNQLLVGFSGKFLFAKNILLYTAVNISHNYHKVIMKCDISSNLDSKSELRLALYRERINLRADIRKKLSNILLLHSRVDFTGCKKERETSLGCLLQQELVASMLGERVGASCRFSWFYAPQWGNRIYSYERDILNQFRTTLIYGEGFRWYINMKASLSAKVDIWLKYSSTYYTDRDKIGEGKEEISGPSKSELKFQLRVKL